MTQTDAVEPAAPSSPTESRKRWALLLLDSAVVLLAAVLPILMVVSNRSAPAVIAAAALFVLASTLMTHGTTATLLRLRSFAANPAAVSGCIFLLWALLSVTWSGNPKSALVDWVAVVVPFAGAGLLLLGLRGHAPAWTALVLTSGMVAAVLGIWIEVKFGYPLSKLLGNRQSAIAFTRPALTILLLFWPLVALLQASRRDLLALTMFMLVVMTASLPHSHAALMAVLVSTLAYGLVQVAPVLTVRLGIVAIVACVLLAPWIAPTLDRALLNGAPQSRSLELPPKAQAGSVLQTLVGSGFNASRWPQEEPSPGGAAPRSGPLLTTRPHNNFLQIRLETGVIGSLLFAAFVAACFRNAWRRPLHVSPPEFGLVAAVALIASSSHGAWQSWWIAALAAATVFVRLGTGPASARVPSFARANGFVTLLSWPRRTLAIRVLAFLHDVLLTGAAFCLALLLRLGARRMLETHPKYWWPTAFIMMIAAVTGPVFGLNSGVWRYASLPDLRGIICAATTTTIFFLIAKQFIPGLEAVPRSVPLGAWFIIVILLSGPRFAYRVWKSSRTKQGRPAREPVLLVGAGSETDFFVREVMERSDLSYDVIGVIDERGRRTGQSIRGVPILGTIEDLPRIVATLRLNERHPEKIIVTRNREDFAGEAVERLLAIALEAELPVLRLPEIGDLSSAASIRLQPISIDDLLYRDPVKLDLAGIHDLVRNARVLVTGGGGSIGSELCRQVAALAPSMLTIVDASEPFLYEIDRQLRADFPRLQLRALIADVRDRAQMFRLLDEAAPAIVFHAAALKHVPIVEAQPREGLMTNVFGTRNVADAAIAANVKAMVMISTDKAINPTSVMGASKRLAELYCQALDVTEATRFITVRFGNVLGSTGSVVPLFQKQIEAGGPITITHPDVKRYFLTIPEAVQLVLQATNYGMRDPSDRGAIFVLDMGPSVKIVDLARKMIRLAGLRVDTDIKLVFIGLRPGEKLFEEMFGVDEPPIPTPADGVLTAYPHVLPRPSVEAIFARLAGFLEGAQDRHAIELLMEAIAEYSPDDRLLEAFAIAPRLAQAAIVEHAK